MEQNTLKNPSDPYFLPQTHTLATEAAARSLQGLVWRQLSGHCPHTHTHTHMKFETRYIAIPTN